LPLWVWGRCSLQILGELGGDGRVLDHGGEAVRVAPRCGGDMWPRSADKYICADLISVKACIRILSTLRFASDSAREESPRMLSQSEKIARSRQCRRNARPQAREIETYADAFAIAV
jgi:hypothetical protein